jgi:hypothetical protein
LPVIDSCDVDNGAWPLAERIGSCASTMLRRCWVSGWPRGTIYELLAREGDRLFPDDYLAYLCTASAKGRPTVPARVVCSVTLLQAH